MKDPIKVLVVILLITLIVFIDMCKKYQYEKNHKEQITHPDSLEKIKICLR